MNLLDPAISSTQKVVEEDDNPGLDTRFLEVLESAAQSDRIVEIKRPVSWLLLLIIALLSIDWLYLFRPWQKSEEEEEIIQEYD